MSDNPKYTVSSGNVFADLGLPDAEEMLAKAELARQISSIVRHRHMTQAEAARVLRTTQPKSVGPPAGAALRDFDRFAPAARAVPMLQHSSITRVGVHLPLTCLQER